MNPAHHPAGTSADESADRTADHPADVTQETIHCVEIRVVAAHGPTEHYIGACRRYRLGRVEGLRTIRAEAEETRQLRWPWRARTAARWLRRCSEADLHSRAAVDRGDPP